jgi:hypothetical protein
MSTITLPSRTDERQRPPARAGVPGPGWLRLAIDPRAEYEDEDEEDLFGDDDEELAEIDEDLDGEELEDEDFESDLDV